MLLLKLGSAHREAIPLVLGMVKLTVHTLDLGARLSKVPSRLLELAAKRTNLQLETIRFSARLLQIMRDMRIERQEKVYLGLRSRSFAIRIHRARRSRHEPSLPSVSAAQL